MERTLLALQTPKDKRGQKCDGTRATTVKVYMPPDILIGRNNTLFKGLGSNVPSSNGQLQAVIF